MHNLNQAIESLRSGGYVCIYDNDKREKETDLFMLARHTEAEHVRYFRQVAGGLIFLAIDPGLAEKIQIPFMTDVLLAAEKHYPLFSHLMTNDLPYDARSAISLSINHRQTFTGVTDKDRAPTSSRLGQLAKELESLSQNEAQRRFGEEFRSPGHLPLCRAAQGLLGERKGHTELAIALAKAAGETYSVVLGCEMLSDDGDALERSMAQAWAKKHGIPMISGEELLNTL